MTLKKEHSNSLKLSDFLLKYWRNQNSLGHWNLEFEICL
jgi:hypothetical protein